MQPTQRCAPRRATTTGSSGSRSLARDSRRRARPCACPESTVVTAGCDRTKRSAVPASDAPHAASFPAPDARPLERLLQVGRLEVDVAEVALGPARLRRQVPVRLPSSKGTRAITPIPSTPAHVEQQVFRRPDRRCCRRPARCRSSVVSIALRTFSGSHRFTLMPNARILPVALQFLHRRLPAVVVGPAVVPDVKLLDVERLDAEVLEAGVGVFDDVLVREDLAAPGWWPCPATRDLSAALGGGDQTLVGVAPQQLAEQPLAPPFTVGPRGIEEVAAQRDGAIERRRRIRHRPTRPPTHAPHAIADFGNRLRLTDRVPPQSAVNAETEVASTIADDPVSQELDRPAEE